MVLSRFEFEYNGFKVIQVGPDISQDFYYECNGKVFNTVLDLTLAICPKTRETVRKQLEKRYEKSPKKLKERLDWLKKQEIKKDD